MFVLVATFLLISGGDTLGTATYNDKFPTEDACKAFLKSADGKKNVTYLQNMATRLKTKVKIECVKGDDNSI